MSVRAGGEADELSGHYPFDLYVLRGETLPERAGRNRAPFAGLLGLPPGPGRCHDHAGSLFWAAEAGF